MCYCYSLRKFKKQHSNKMKLYIIRNSYKLEIFVNDNVRCPVLGKPLQKDDWELI